MSTHTGKSTTPLGNAETKPVAAAIMVEPDYREQIRAMIPVERRRWIDRCVAEHDMWLHVRGHTFDAWMATMANDVPQSEEIQKLRTDLSVLMNRSMAGMHGAMERIHQTSEVSARDEL